MIFTNKRPRKIFLKIFLSYILFLIIPVFTIIYIYNISIEAVSDLSKSETYDMLNQVKTIVDVRLNEIEIISEYISNNQNLITVLKYNKDNIKDNLLNVYKICNDMPNYQLTNSFIDKIYLISKSSNIVISPGAACEYTRILHDNLFSNIAYDYDYWTNFLWNTKLPDDFMLLENSNSNTHSNLVYLSAIPDPFAFPHNSALYISTKNSFFIDVFKQVDTGKKGLVCIMDENGTIVSSFKEKDFDLDLPHVFSSLSKNSFDDSFNDYIITSVQSDANKWVYYSLIPKKVILMQVSKVKKIILLLILIALAVGCIIAYKLASQKASTLRNIIKYLSPFAYEKSIEKKQDEYKYIESKVSHLISNNNELSMRLEQQKNTINSSKIRSLMFADFFDKDEFNKLLDNSSLDFNNKQFAIMSISMDFNDIDNVDDNYSITRIFFEETAQQILDDNIYIVYIDEKNIAAITVFDTSLLIEQCHKYINELATIAHNECHTKYNTTLRFAVSPIYKNITKIHKAYEQSKHSLQYHFNDNNDNFIIFEDNHFLRTDLYYYPIEVELKLMQFVKYGDYKLLKKLLKKIYEENFINRSLSQSMKKQLMFAMRGTIIRGLQNIVLNDNIKEMINELDTAVSTEDILYYANHINLEICKTVVKIKNKEDENLKREILDYIDKCYTDSNFCIQNIVEKFSLNTNYVYQQFRENIGVSFSTVLENKRIEKACELIVNTKMHVKDIALNVGYNSDNSFRRAFKRVMGMLPLEYEKSVK